MTVNTGPWSFHWAELGDAAAIDRTNTMSRQEVRRPMANRTAPDDDRRHLNRLRSAAVRYHALAEQADRVHDPLMRRPARMRMAQAQQEVLRARRLLPALELAHARFGVPEDQPIGREILQRERRIRWNHAELGQLVFPVIAVGGHD